MVENNRIQSLKCYKSETGTKVDSQNYFLALYVILWDDLELMEALFGKTELRMNFIFLRISTSFKGQFFDIFHLKIIIEFKIKFFVV